MGVWRGSVCVACSLAEHTGLRAFTHRVYKRINANEGGRGAYLSLVSGIHAPMLGCVPTTR